jgi:hypothetical protein
MDDLENNFQAGNMNFEKYGEPDCNDAANISHPSCQIKFCSGPEGYSHPNCKQGNQAGNGSDNPFGNGASNGDLSTQEDDEFLGEQGLANNLNGESSALGSLAKGSSSAGGSGLGGGGGSGGGLGALDQGSEAGSVSNGDSNFMRNLNGTKGYSSSGGKWGASGGGGYSYASGSRRELLKTTSPKPFNLKGLLNKKDVNARGVASSKVGTRKGEIGAKHEDIWTRMSRRYQNICISNRLWHCQEREIKFNH